MDHAVAVFYFKCCLPLAVILIKYGAKAFGQKVFWLHWCLLSEDADETATRFTGEIIAFRILYFFNI